MIFKPDSKYFEGLAGKIVRLSGTNPDKVELVKINCGNSGMLGEIVLKTGETIKVH
jgi:hypothetical protein